jgi:hypothetical protein
MTTVGTKLDLPTYDMSQALEFADARGFKDWLKLVPMINVRQAHHDVLDVLGRLNRSPVLPIERLKMLELLRDAVSLLQEENAKRYFGKPFPLADAEDTIWRGNVRLWLAMSTGYRHCWQAALTDDPGIVEHKALCGQRALRYASLAIREHHLAYRAVPKERWADLYSLYRLALDAEIANKIVKDSLNRQTELSSCTAAFLQALLLAATNPSAMPVRQIAWTDRLLDRWSNQSTMSAEVPEDVERGVLAILLDDPGELRRYDPPPVGERWRYIEIEQIGRSIKKRIKYLRAGELPAQLGLGEEYAAASAESYLIGLYQEWCDLPVERGMPRHARSADMPPAEVGINLMGAHLAVNGGAFVQPDEPAEIRGRQIADYQLFGGQSQYHSASKKQANDTGPELEAWRIDNESALGFKLTRAEPGERVIHNLLVAVRARPGQPIVAGTIRWLTEGESGQIVMGVRVLPGIPQAVGIRATGVNAFGNTFTQALLLPAMGALQTQATLIVPSTWFKPGRIVEVYLDGQIRKVKMDQLVERGQEFERVSFQGELG